MPGSAAGRPRWCADDALGRGIACDADAPRERDSRLYVLAAAAVRRRGHHVAYHTDEAAARRLVERRFEEVRVEREGTSGHQTAVVCRRRSR
jgi:hypothetical protein